MITIRKPALVLAALAVATGASAQSASLDTRVGKLEKEMKAVQRTVFPQGVPLQPEIGAATPATPAGDAATTPLSDVTARVDALEKNLAALTGQVEQAGFRNKQQDDLISALEGRLKLLEGGAAPVAPVASATPAAPNPATATPASSRPPVVATRNDPKRKAAVAAIEIPSTGDAAEDAYTYAYRLYAAKFYPEAQVKLKEFVARYPAHRRASYAQNLLGRAYFDEGKPALASVAFYDNYEKMPKGDRASESLYWLGQSLTRLNKLPDACKVYDELSAVYGTKLTAEMKAKVAKGRADAKCGA